MRDLLHFLICEAERILSSMYKEFRIMEHSEYSISITYLLLFYSYICSLQVPEVQ